jgi:helix-turn-helix protein
VIGTSTPVFSQKGRLLTADEVAQLLQIRPRTVRNWAREGRLERVRLSSKCVGFTAASTEALINPLYEQSPAAEPGSRNLAEAEGPAAGGFIGPELIDRAAEIIQFTLDCWRALPAHDSLALSRRDEVLDRGIAKLVDWLERRPERKATGREIQRAPVAGVRTRSELDALLGRYEDTFPGSVATEAGSHGGRPSKVVKAPTRSIFPNVGLPDNGIGADQNGHKQRGFAMSGSPDIEIPDIEDDPDGRFAREVDRLPSWSKQDWSDDDLQDYYAAIDEAKREDGDDGS